MSAKIISSLRDRDWGVLLDSIERENCIPLLGPDLCTVDEKGARRNLASDLSSNLASILYEEKKIQVEDPHNLSLVAQSFQNQLSRDDLRAEVKQFYAEHENGLAERRDATFERLAALPFPLYVTSRHDTTLKHFLEQAGKSPCVKSYHFKGDRTATLGYLGTIEEPVIYRLYGSYNERGSLVITEHDLLDFLQSVVAGDPGLPIDLQNVFNNKNFLFLGFGLGNYHLRVLLHALKLNKSIKSFALESAPLADTQDAFRLRFKESVLVYSEIGYQALKLLESGLEEFVEELDRRWTDRHPEGVFEPDAQDTADEQVSDGPSVFISYVKEDEDRAGKLFEFLRQEGLNPWIDTDGLRWGNKWNDELEDTVMKEVDYFVVLQSRALSDRTESYVHKEVKLALERQDLRAGRFIFPVQIDEGAERLQALERAKIQTGVLSDWNQDVKKLAREIRRDHERQKRG
ncbi:MAG: toll/interleukin-1 receptor domain-containing protein [Hyphomicrobiales bacterium]|nr:toll/interleukin-1 receptor domain-containing protein [Hyphomicrobiales bacterium]